MTRSGQRALLILAAMLVVLAGLYAWFAYQTAHYQHRSTCIAELRSEWEQSMGNIVITGLDTGQPTGPQVTRLRTVQVKLGHLDEECPL